MQARVGGPVRGEARRGGCFQLSAHPTLAALGLGTPGSSRPAAVPLWVQRGKRRDWLIKRSFPTSVNTPLMEWRQKWHWRDESKFLWHSRDFQNCYGIEGRGNNFCSIEGIISIFVLLFIIRHCDSFNMLYHKYFSPYRNGTFQYIMLIIWHYNDHLREYPRIYIQAKGYCSCEIILQIKNGNL